MSRTIRGLEFALATDPTEYDRVDEVNRLTVRATDSSGERLVDQSYGCVPSPDFVAGPLFAAESILDGEAVTLFDCSLADRRIAVTPVDGRPALDIRSLPAGETVDIDGPIPISNPAIVVDAAIDFADTNLAHRRARADSDDSACHRLHIAVGLDDARRQLTHYRAPSTGADYEPTLDRDHLEQFLFDCRTNDHLVAFVAGTDALDAFIINLRDRDDEYAADAYRRLLGYHDEIRGRALTVLRDESGDERATPFLENVCLAATPDHSPVALDALAKTDRDTAIDVATTLVRNDETDVALAAADLLADIGAETVDGGSRSRIDRAFEQAIAEADCQTKAELAAAAERFRT